MIVKPALKPVLKRVLILFLKTVEDIIQVFDRRNRNFALHIPTLGICRSPPFIVCTMGSGSFHELIAKNQPEAQKNISFLGTWQMGKISREVTLC